ncbi:hypothetical protein K3727_09650 [Rhodobacteraceae bacterium M382]|nr:hypothetical protein K3727_09650 [Rhodobacteraceae bacterium M382]
MPYRNRIKENRYTDSDVARFYIDQRGNHGTFIREIGDFVAHPARDKGAAFNAVVSTYAQFAFYQRYGFAKKAVDPIGDCEWWLQPYFLRKTASYKDAELKKHLKMSRPELTALVKSWFPDKEKFPKKIEATDPFRFFDVVDFFRQSMKAEPTFEVDTVKKDLRSAFKSMGLGAVKVDDFLIGTATLLNGMEIALPEGVTVGVHLYVRRQRGGSRTSAGSRTLASVGHQANALPDGLLEISLVTNTPPRQKLFDQQIAFLETKIDTKRYFDRSLVRNPSTPFAELDLRAKLQFVSDSTPMVSVVCDCQGRR